MHGVVMRGLRNFVIESYGRSTWEELKTAATDRSETYLPLTVYPDEELQAIVETATDELDVSREELLIEFGTHLMGDLMDMYFVYFDEDWNALDVIENVEEAIHEALRNRSAATFTPPNLRTKRLAEDEIVLEYRSDRNLFGLGKGLIKGVATEYNEPLEIRELRSKQAGDDRDILLIKRRSDIQSQIY